MESKEIGTGAFGVFVRELVEANHLWQANGGVNVQVRTFSYRHVDLIPDTTIY
jgi:hypothetical protein